MVSLAAGTITRIANPPLGFTRHADPLLYSWGMVQFEVEPLNLHEVDHTTMTSWAKKPIVGAANYREWTGEEDDELHLRGRIFPFRIGGLANLDAVEAARKKGVAALMMRGDGRYLGWYVIERMQRHDTYLAINGVGQQIEFEALFIRVPVPSAEDEYPVYFELGQAG
jgi:phage protein U